MWCNRQIWMVVCPRENYYYLRWCGVGTCRYLLPPTSIEHFCCTEALSAVTVRVLIAKACDTAAWSSGALQVLPDQADLLLISAQGLEPPDYM